MLYPSGYGGSAPQTCNPDLFGGSGLRFHRVWVRMPAGQFRPSPNFLIQTFGSWLSCSRSVTYDDLASESAALRSSTPMLWIFAAMVIYGDRIPLRFFKGSEATFSGGLDCQLEGLDCHLPAIQTPGRFVLRLGVRVIVQSFRFQRSANKWKQRDTRSLGDCLHDESVKPPQSFTPPTGSKSNRLGITLRRKTSRQGHEHLPKAESCSTRGHCNCEL